MEAADWGLLATQLRGRTVGCGVIVRGFGRLSSLPRLARPNTHRHTTLGGLLKAHTGEEDVKNHLASHFISG